MGALLGIARSISGQLVLPAVFSVPRFAAHFGRCLSSLVAARLYPRELPGTEHLCILKVKFSGYFGKVCRVEIRKGELFPLEVVLGKED